MVPGLSPTSPPALLFRRSARSVADADGHVGHRIHDRAHAGAGAEDAVLADEPAGDDAVLPGAVRHRAVDRHIADRSAVRSGEDADELAGPCRSGSR